MKKQMLFAAAALALAACTNEEVVYTGQPQEISFEAVGNKATRAVVDGTNLTANGGAYNASTNPYLKMWATAIYKTGKGSSDIHTPYFTNAEFQRGAGDEYWSGTTKYYYPANGTDDDHMDFMAYSISTAGADNASTITADWETTTVDWQDEAKKGSTIDLLKMQFNPELDGKQDVLYSDPSIGNSCPPSTPPVLDFKHALAWLWFNVTVKNNTAGVVKVKSITMTGISLSGDVTIKYDYDSMNDKCYTTPVWSNLNGPITDCKPINVTAGAEPGNATVDVTGKVTAPKVYGGVLVPEQNRSGFTMVYTIANGTGTPIELTYTYNPGDHSTGNAASPSETYADLKWMPGKKYIYNIEIGLNEILLNAAVSNYEEEGYTIEVSSTTSVSGN